jgi:hypothetical protein
LDSLGDKIAGEGAALHKLDKRKLVPPGGLLRRRDARGPPLLDHFETHLPRGAGDDLEAGLVGGAHKMR